MPLAPTLLCILAMLGILGTIVAYTLITGISPMPTSRKAREAMLTFIPENQVGKIYDLGSGWGTLLAALASARPQCRVTGYELSPVPWLVSCCRRRANLAVYRRDFLAASLEDASVVLCYLYPGAMEKLRPKFEAELRPGALVISNTFAVPSWTPQQVVTLPGLFPTMVYLYEVPAAPAS